MPADEFEVIRTLFAPLATHAGARGLVDDAAVLEAQGTLVITTDAIVEGVHFLRDDPIETVAQKALRVNISDLVGKGAKPMAALIALVWPNDRPAEQIARFAGGLRQDLEYFEVALIGGDTTSTPGPLAVCVTALGAPLGARTPSRADAKPGDDAWIMGAQVGAAHLGLQARAGKLAGIEPGSDEASRLISAYLVPDVRVEAAGIVARYAHASMDVSDGLVADAGKLAAASRVRLRIDASEVPLDPAAHRWVEAGGDLAALLTAGDDYCVLFTAPRGRREELAALEPLRPRRIGAVEAGDGVRVMDAAGSPLAIDIAGYAHKLGR